MNATSTDGRFVWYDLMTSDTDAAMAFYRDVVEWGTQERTGGEKPYTMWTAQDAPIGGVMDLPPGSQAPPTWIGYVAVADPDASCRRAKELGGKVHHATTVIPSVGRFAVLGDPQGAAIAVFAPDGASPGGKGEPRVGDFSWTELATADHEKAFGFYSALFGWEKRDAMDMGEMGVYQIFGLGDQMLGGMFNRTADMPGPPSWLYYIRVSDLDAALQRVSAGGGRMLNGPMEVPGGRIAQCLDPQGAAFALHQIQEAG